MRTILGVIKSPIAAPLSAGCSAGFIVLDADSYLWSVGVVESGRWLVSAAKSAHRQHINAQTAY